MQQQRDAMRFLPRLVLILAILLVILASFAVIYVLFTFLHRFGQVVFLFCFGAIVAYVLTPLVNAIQIVVRRRWAAILSVYLLLVMGLTLLGFLLFTPFIQQSQSLVQNLHNPAPSSMQAIGHVRQDVSAIQAQLTDQSLLVAGGSTIPPAAATVTQTRITVLQSDLKNLALGITGRPAPTIIGPFKRQQAVVPQTQTPPSYVTPAIDSVNRMAADYANAVHTPNNVLSRDFSKPIADVKATAAQVQDLQHAVSTTPVLILRAQTWLDQRGIKVNLRDNFGKAVSELTNRGTSLLNNAVGILSKAANTLIETMLVLIISIYFLSDGHRLIHWAIHVLPLRYQDEAAFFMQSTDKVLGAYLRGQIVLALLAGVLGGGGAAALGVPYPVLIGVTTFLLELVPVIGPVILILPPVMVSAIFQPIATTILILVYFVVFQQIVTNIIGPRVIGTAVGIHPLEAMAAALVGYPLAGFLGSFMAIPAVGILHIIIREAHREFTHTEATESTAAKRGPQPQPGSRSQTKPATDPGP